MDQPTERQTICLYDIATQLKTKIEEEYVTRGVGEDKLKQVRGRVDPKRFPDSVVIQSESDKSGLFSIFEEGGKFYKWTAFGNREEIEADKISSELEKSIRGLYEEFLEPEKADSTGGRAQGANVPRHYGYFF